MFRDKEKGTMEDLVSKKEKLKRENDELKKLIDKTEFEKNDAKALIIAALTTIVPVVLIACLLFYLVIKFVFKF
ncbi:hypothetical protein [Psychrilyobacter atlanticus]|uniref:hypothetical protein n=1 Tax=Psychrilyobacter atlanticus TaxID=271091 RepID=UPI00042A2001|nr:hypothetical protein [Psychrilyobacter atlanticus]